MAANVTRAELVAWAQQLSDTENDPNVSTTAWNALANRHVYELWDKLVDAGPADYYASTTQITTSSGVIPYALPSDFRNLVGMYVRGPGPEDRRALVPMPEGARGSYQSPQTDGIVIDLEYIPTAPQFAADGDTIDGISGWAELIANLMARDVMIKRESLTQDVVSNIARLEQRIVLRSRQRDRGPRRISDLDEVMARRYPPPYSAWASNTRIACYRLRADNVELYEPVWTIP